MPVLVRDNTYSIELGKSRNSPTHDWNEYFASQGSFARIFDHKHPGPPYNDGGPFELRRFKIAQQPSPSFHLVQGPIERFLRFVPKTSTNMPSDLSHLNANTKGISNYSAYGPAAWNRFKPGNSTAQAGQLLGEAHEIPGMVRRLPNLLLGKLKHLADAGNRYLDVVFGWQPLLRDLQELHQTQTRLAANLAQLRRDNGKGVRRGGTLWETSDVSFVDEGPGYYLDPAMTTAFYAQPTWRETITTVTERVWFSGKFRYHIPDIETPNWERRATRALYGLNPTPKLLYDLLPWSWLIDWFSNVGDTLANVSQNSAENLVADYAYLMGQYTKVVQTNVWAYVKDPSTGKTFNASCASTVTYESKTRQAASPYGFGITFDALSARQVGILSALGVSRSRF